MPLNSKQQRFVAEYLVDLNATQAAIRTGYSAKTAGAQGSRLLTHVEIAAAVQAATSKQLGTAELSAVRVLEEYRRLAFSDVRNLFDAEGNLVPIHALSAEVASALASVEVVKKNVAAGDGKVDTIHKVRVWDKTKALDSLAKHFGLLIDKVDHQGEVTVRWADGS